MLITCPESLSRLSDYHDGSLEEAESLLVQEHLASCSPCEKVFSELELIVQIAAELDSGDTLNFPDEALLWARLKVTTSGPH
jgi:predicted anti-sigma-YlaC factor YlaD